MRWQLPIDGRRYPGAIIVALVVLAVGAPVTYLALWGAKWGLDLHVYRLGSSSLIHGHDPYQELFTVHRLSYTYPPVALLALLPLDVLPRDATRILWWFASAACVGLTLWMVLRTSWSSSRGMLCAVVVMSGVGCVVLEPVRSTLNYGQVNAALMALVVADVLVFKRVRGVGVGVAAAVKLTPLFFIVLLAVDRDWHAVRRMVTTFAILNIAVWILYPRACTDYWLHQALQISRPGDPAFVGNQSIPGALYRLHLAHGIVLTAWALASCLVVGAVVLIARQALHCGARPLAVLVVAIGGLLVSPISWSHHWIWVCLVPAIALIHGYRGLGWSRTSLAVPWLVLAVSGLAPYWWHLDGPLGAIADDGLVIAGVVLLCVWARASRTTTPWPPPASRGPSGALLARPLGLVPDVAGFSTEGCAASVPSGLRWPQRSGHQRLGTATPPYDEVPAPAGPRWGRRRGARSARPR